MPDFTNPIIVSAMISVGGVVVATVANLFYNAWYRKADFNERCFFEAYKRRLAVYEDIVRELNSMKDPNILIRSISAREVRDKIFTEYIHTLGILTVRLCLYGSLGSRKLFHSFIVQMRALPFDEDVIEPQAGAHYRAVLLNFLENALNEFTEFVSGETGNNLVDKKIMKFAERVERHKNKAHDKKNPDFYGPHD
jgi:hypothetical protein